MPSFKYNPASSGTRLHTEIKIIGHIVIFKTIANGLHMCCL